MQILFRLSSQITAEFTQFAAVAGFQRLLPALTQQQQAHLSSATGAAGSSVAHSKRGKQQKQHNSKPPRQQQRRRQGQQQQQQPCTLTVAVIGLPNAGKSTLTNRLIGHKISGVSSKRNTTIDPQLGSFNVGASQVLLYDTPGLVDEPGQGNPIERLRSAWATAAVADQLLLIVDAERQFRVQDPALLKLVHQVAAGPPDSLGSNWQQPPAILFLNKQDKLEANIRATVLQQLRQQLGGLLGFTRVFEGAAMLGQGVPELKQYLAQQAKPGPWLMPAGQSHAASPGELAVELVREKLFRRLNQELPYKLIVRLDGVNPLLLQHGSSSASSSWQQDSAIAAGSDTAGGGGPTTTTSQPPASLGPAPELDLAAAVLPTGGEGASGVAEVAAAHHSTPLTTLTPACEPRSHWVQGLTDALPAGADAAGSLGSGSSGVGGGASDVSQGSGLCIKVTVGVASKSIKAIVVGKGGQVIQHYVARPTQAELCRILKQPVKLVVGVKVMD